MSRLVHFVEDAQTASCARPTPGTGAANSLAARGRGPRATSCGGRRARVRGRVRRARRAGHDQDAARTRQLELLPVRADQQVQRRPARDGVVLSVRRADLQSGVRHDVLYGLGRNASSLVALDAATGKELWVHDGLNGITSKGINYWESADGKDRRLIFAVDSFLQADRRAHRQVDHDLRRQRHRRHAGRACRGPRGRARARCRRVRAASGATS